MAQVGSPELVDAADLERFAGRGESREFLPHLLRLLLTTTPGVTAVSVRAGDSIGMPGYDGQCNGGSGSPYVPSGLAVWELGTGNDPRKKAQSDYRSRTDDPLGVTKADTTFVAVTLRRWDESDRGDWLLRRNAEREWHRVVALDADDLHGWLELTPQVHIWASEQLGRRPLDAMTMDAWWARWSAHTRPALPPALLRAGRSTQVDELRLALASEARIVGVHSGAREESTAFVAAAFQAIDPDDEQALIDAQLPLTAVVTSAEAWHRLANVSSPSTLVAGEAITASDMSHAVSKGHHVIAPMGVDDDAARATIVLPRIARDAGRDALVSSGWAFQQADRDAARARMNLQSLRRAPRLAVSPQFERPNWARGTMAETVASLCLVGAWTARVWAGRDDERRDTETVAFAVDTDAPGLERLVVELATTEDPPIRLSGDHWRLSAPADAWSLLRFSLTAGALERWSKAFMEVLGETDPSLSLPTDERPLAGLRGIQAKWSARLREGVAQGAALLGSSEDEKLVDGSRFGDHAASSVQQLLKLANADETGLVWRSLAGTLPLLAEAAPSTFLEAVEQGLKGDSPVLLKMFTDNEESSSWGTSSEHTGLLWALETLCWTPTWLSRAIDALAHLARMDPGGRLSNRPAESLRRILLPWLPNTAAPVARRKLVLEGLLVRRPHVTWPLLLSLLPSNHGFSHSTHVPAFRDWQPDSTRPTQAEWVEATQDVLTMALGAAREEPSRWESLIQHVADLPREMLLQALDGFELVDGDALGDDQRLAIWQRTHELTMRHRKFPDAGWSLGNEELARLEAKAALLEPKDSPRRLAWLFDYHPDLPGIDPFDHEGHAMALKEHREAAVRETLAGRGVQGLEEIAQDSALPGAVGATAADVGHAHIETAAIAMLNQPEGQLRIMAMGWVQRSAELHGDEWIQGLLEALDPTAHEARSAVFLCLPGATPLWDRIETEHAEVQDRYWRQVGYFGPQSDREELAARLIAKGRAWSAIDLLALLCHPSKDDTKPSADLVVQALTAALAPDISEKPRPGSLDYDVGLLLDHLVQSGASEAVLFELELAYFPLMEHSRTPKAVFRKLAEGPDLFVEAVTLTYRGKHEEPQERDKAKQRQAQLAYGLLRVWRRPPGTQEDGSIDSAVLSEWVDDARAMLAERDRADVGDQCIGEVLSGSPRGTDDAWPHESVRDVLERIGSEELETGLSIGKFNSRGVTSRGAYEGGKQELDLSSQYQQWADELLDRWPRTGRLLHDMAASSEGMPPGWTRRRTHTRTTEPSLVRVKLQTRAASTRLSFSNGGGYG